MSQRKSTVDAMVATFVGEAEAAPTPEARETVLRRAARTLVGFAADQRNAKAAPRLRTAAAEFLQAAQEMSRAADERPPVSDDFTELLAETAEADAATHHDIDREARRLEIHEERHSDARMVSIAPASFKADTPLGRQVQVRYPTTPSVAPAVDPVVAQADAAAGILQSDTAAFWQGAKREAQAMSVDIAVVKPPPAATRDSLGINQSPVARLYASVTYGVDGNNTTVEVDVGRGVRLTVPGNFVAVLVGAEPVPLKSNEYSPVVTVGVSIAAFAAPSAAPVLRTVYVDGLTASLPGAVSPLLRVPARAVVIMIPQLDTNAGGSLLLKFYAGEVTVVQQVTFTLYGPTPVPVPGDATHFQVVNSTGVAANVRVVFQLSL